jgi:hypothetical protein
MSTLTQFSEPELKGRLNTPISPKKAKALGLHPITDYYLISETWMVLNALKDLRASRIMARTVHSTEGIPGAVEVWRK